MAEYILTKLGKSAFREYLRVYGLTQAEFAKANGLHKDTIVMKKDKAFSEKALAVLSEKIRGTLSEDGTPLEFREDVQYIDANAEVVFVRNQPAIVDLSADTINAVRCIYRSAVKNEKWQRLTSAFDTPEEFESWFDGYDAADESSETCDSEPFLSLRVRKCADNQKLPVAFLFGEIRPATEKRTIGFVPVWYLLDYIVAIDTGRKAKDSDFTELCRQKGLNLGSLKRSRVPIARLLVANLVENLAEDIAEKKVHLLTFEVGPFTRAGTANTSSATNVSFPTKTLFQLYGKIANDLAKDNLAKGDRTMNAFVPIFDFCVPEEREDGLEWVPIIPVWCSLHSEARKWFQSSDKGTTFFISFGKLMEILTVYYQSYYDYIDEEEKQTRYKNEIQRELNRLKGLYQQKSTIPVRTLAQFIEQDLHVESQSKRVMSST